MGSLVRRFFLLCTPLLMLCGCHDSFETIYTDAVVIDENYQPVEDTVLTDSVQHFKFSRLHRADTYGIRLAYKVPPESQGKSLYVIVSGRTRTNLAYSTGHITISSGSKKNGQTSIDALEMRYQYTDVNRWCDFRDSVRLAPEYWNKRYDAISIVAHLSMKSVGENFDLDGFHVTIKQIKE
jgi:hypothetical protein